MQGTGKATVGYNVQFAVDIKNHLIIAHAHECHDVMEMAALHIAVRGLR
jgi:hypothetical protein